MDKWEKDEYESRIQELEDRIDNLEEAKDDKEERIRELEEIINDAISKLEEAWFCDVVSSRIKRG